MRFWDAEANPVAPTSCDFLGGIVSGLFGGGGGNSTSVEAQQNTTVNVEVNPNIGVAVDLEPVSALAQEIAQGNIETGEQLAAALGGQGLAFLSGFKGLSDAVSEQGRALALIAAAGVALFYFTKGRA